jgi:hypothetical protein
MKKSGLFHAKESETIVLNATLLTNRSRKKAKKRPVSKMSGYDNPKLPDG